MRPDSVVHVLKTFFVVFFSLDVSDGECVGVRLLGRAMDVGEPQTT